jgi:UDP-galactopyranose mutase
MSTTTTESPEAHASTSSRVLVIGAGVAGLSAAWLLTQAGRTVEVWDSADQHGGLLQPVRFRGHPMDRGSHRIHPESHPLLRQITAEEDWVSRPRQGRLVLGGRTMGYPPRMVDFLQGLGLGTVVQMGLNFATRKDALAGFRRWEEDRRQAVDDVGFARFVEGRVGRRAYTQFYAPYVEKVWGLDPNEISQTVAKARISTASPWVTLARSLNRKGEPDRVFLYPRGGMHRVTENLLEKLAAAQVPVHYGRRFGPAEVATESGPVVFSGHLSHLVPDADLEHRGLYLLHLAFDPGTFGEVDTFYCPEAKFWFGRVSQPAQFSEDLADGEHDIVCVEIPEGRWGAEHDFIADLDTIQEQLSIAGIIPVNAHIRDSLQTFIPRVYPMYRRGWIHRWRAALDTLTARSEVFPIGRQGLFLHCNIDQCVHIADEAVRHIGAGGDARAWIDRCEDFLELRVRD